MMIVRFTKTFPIRVTEWLVSLIMFSWSIACFNLTATEWDRPYYSGLARIWPQQTWAVLAFTVALMRLTALTINGAWRPSPHLRAIGAFLACFLWLQICFGLFTNGLSSTGAAIYPWFFLADIYNIFRASHDAGLSDDRARASKGRRKNGSANPAAY